MFTKDENEDNLFLSWDNFKVRLGKSSIDFQHQADTLITLFTALEHIKKELGNEAVAPGNFIHNRLSSIFNAFKRKDPSLNGDISSIIGFYSMMIELEKREPIIYKKIRRRLRDQINSPSWIGSAFELDIAHRLARRGLAFTLQDPPNADFKIVHFTKEIHLELTTIFKKELTPYKSSAYKISAAISAKNKKPYADRNTILFVEISSHIFHQEHSQLEFKKIEDEIKESLNSHNFGAVVLHYSFVEQQIDLNLRYCFVYTSFIHSDATASVTDFINTYYPKNGFKDVNPYIIQNSNY